MKKSKKAEFDLAIFRLMIICCAALAITVGATIVMYSNDIPNLFVTPATEPATDSNEQFIK